MIASRMRVDVLAGRQVHHRVGAVVDRRVQLLQLAVDVAGDGRVADVGVHLAAGRDADRHRLQPPRQRGRGWPESPSAPPPPRRGSVSASSDSRLATYSISGVTWPARACSNCVIGSAMARKHPRWVEFARNSSGPCTWSRRFEFIVSPSEGCQPTTSQRLRDTPTQRALLFAESIRKFMPALRSCPGAACRNIAACRPRSQCLRARRPARRQQCRRARRRSPARAHRPALRSSPARIVLIVMPRPHTGRSVWMQHVPQRRRTAVVKIRRRAHTPSSGGARYPPGSATTSPCPPVFVDPVTLVVLAGARRVSALEPHGICAHFLDRHDPLRIARPCPVVPIRPVALGARAD